MIPILETTKKQMLAKVDKRLHPLVMDLVDDGKEMMWDAKTRHMAAKALAQTSPTDIGNSFAAMTVVLHSQVGGQVPMDALVTAGILLLCEGLQFVTDAGTAKVDNNFLAAATQAFGEKLLELLKATPDRLQAEVDNHNAKQSKPATPQPTGIVSGTPGAA